MPDETNGINNAASCYKEAEQMMLSLLRHGLPVFDEICRTAVNFVSSLMLAWCKEGTVSQVLSY